MTEVSHKDTGRRSFIIVLCSLLVFIIYTVIVKTMNVKPIGPNGSSVGLADINGNFHVLTGFNPLFYDLTELLGVIEILTCLVFGSIGFVQMIKRKSLFKVDRDLLYLCGFYIFVIALYILFEFVVINYRPVIIDGELEASYPSSHTLLIVCVMSTAVMQICRRVKDNKVKTLLCVICIVLMVAGVLGRLLSGVHWLTDIVGSLLLSVVPVYSYYALCRHADLNSDS